VNDGVRRPLGSLRGRAALGGLRRPAAQVLEDALTDLRINPGDEVRWINQRSMPVTVEFLGAALDAVTCARGFGERGLTNPLGRLWEETTIEPNDGAGLCFTTVGTVIYNARMEPAVAGGETIESGTIRIGQ